MSKIYDRILITGSGGMLAQAVARNLSARGIESTALSHNDLDVADENGVGPLFHRLEPTLVLNCAAYTKVDRAEQEEQAANQTNALGAEVLARACESTGALLVHFSTDFVFDGKSTRPYRPGDATNPIGAYGRSKLAGEVGIQLQTQRFLIVRTAWLYGPGGPCFPQTMINAARAGKPLSVVGDQIGSPTFTDDLADATLRLIDARAGGIYHVVNAGQTTWYDFTLAIMEEFGLKAELSRTTSDEWRKQRPDSAIRPAFSVLDISEYSKTTGQTMRSWREALSDFHRAIGA